MLRDHPSSEPWRREAPRDSTYYSVLRMAGRPMAFPPRHCLPPRLSSPSCLLRRKTDAQCVRSSIFGFSYIIVIMTWLLDVQLPSSWELPMVTTPSMRHLHRLTVLSYVPYCYSFNTRPYIPNNPHLTSLINKHEYPGQTSPYTNQWTFNKVLFQVDEDGIENVDVKSKRSTEQPAPSGDGCSAEPQHEP